MMKNLIFFLYEKSYFKRITIINEDIDNHIK